MKKLFYLLSISCVISISCVDRNMPGEYYYSFSVLDSTYNNLIGDSVNPNRYYIDSIGFYSSNNIKYSNNFRKISLGLNNTYIFTLGTRLNSNDNYIIKYSSHVIENDTMLVSYGNKNINIYRNGILIFSKNHISQTTDIHFDILK